MLLLRRVVGGSMLPTLRSGQVVVAVRVRRRSGRLQTGQLVVVRHDGLDKIKRIKSVQDGRIFVVGDNPQYSTDSRHFGWLPDASIRGRIIWPRPRRS